MCRHFRPQSHSEPKEVGHHWHTTNCRILLQRRLLPLRFHLPLFKPLGVHLRALHYRLRLVATVDGLLADQKTASVLRRYWAVCWTSRDGAFRGSVIHSTAAVPSGTGCLHSDYSNRYGATSVRLARQGWPA